MSIYVKYNRTSTALLITMLLAALVLSPTGTQPARALVQPSASPSVVFVGNAGQTDPAVRFMAIGGGAALFAAGDGLWLRALAPSATEQPGEPAQGRAAIPKARASTNVKLSFAGSIAHTFENTATLALGGQPANPSKPYTMAIHYSDTEKGSAIEDTLALYTWDGTAWVKEPSSVVNAAQNTITATANHFGRWAVLGTTKHTFLTMIN